MSKRRRFCSVILGLILVLAALGPLAGCGSQATATPAPSPTAAPVATEAPAATAAPAATETPSAATTGAAKKVWLVNSIRSLSNPYHALWNKGGQLFAKDTGLSDTYQVLLSEGDSTKQLDDIKAMLAKAGKDVVFNVDPNETANARPIADMLEKAGVYFVTNWNKPEDLHPWDYKYWVVHMQPDDVQMGYETSKAMFEKLGGKGKVVYIEGMMGNTASSNRFAGFQKALKEYPGIELLDHQPADWDQTKAQKVVEAWLVKYPQIDAIGTAGDMLALGAVAALRAGRPEGVGKILITGCAGDEPTTKAILNGEVFATNGIDAIWQGGMGLSYAYQAYLGKLDPSQLPKAKREFYFGTTLVTKDNAQKWLDDVVQAKNPKYDWTDLWSRVLPAQ